MTLDRSECDHVLIRLPWGELYDGGIGVHTDQTHLPKFIIDDMPHYDHATLEKWSYGLNRTYPRFCPAWNKDTVSQMINKHLERIVKLDI